MFFEELDRLEQHIMLNFKQTSPSTVVEAAYYFCKFQRGSEKFWTKVEQTDLTQLEITPLSRLALAMVMNNRPISAEVSDKLFS